MTILVLRMKQMFTASIAVVVASMAASSASAQCGLTTVTAPYTPPLMQSTALAPRPVTNVSYYTPGVANTYLSQYTYCTTQCMKPEIKYKWTYSQIPRTDIVGVTVGDACGQPRTLYQPVTTYSILPWLHREAYVEYTPAPAPVAAYTPSYCDPCGSSCGYSCETTCSSGCGASFSDGIASPGCSSCSGGGSISPGPISGGSDPGYGAPSTFRTQSPVIDYDVNQPTLAPTPIPEIGDPNNGSHNGEKLDSTRNDLQGRAPQFIVPAGRTALRPIETSVNAPIIPAAQSISWDQPEMELKPIRTLKPGVWTAVE